MGFLFVVRWFGKNVKYISYKLKCNVEITPKHFRYIFEVYILKFINI